MKILKPKFQTREIRAYSNRSTSPVLSHLNRTALNNTERTVSPFIEQYSFRCNAWIGAMDKLVALFNKELPNSDKQGFIQDWNRKSGYIQMNRKDYKGRTVTVFSLEYSFGHTYLTIEGAEILRIERDTVHYYDGHAVVATRYDVENPVPSVILNAFKSFINKAQSIECSFVQPKKEIMDAWNDDTHRYVADGAYPIVKPITAKTAMVSVKCLGTSKTWTRWNVTLKDRENRNYVEYESGSFPTAYKVEINGVVAWLPHSILGLRHNALSTRSSYVSQSIVVPTWWVNSLGK